MTSRHDILADWLRDAYAMETNVISMLEKQIKAMESHPVVKQRLQQHVKQSEVHAEKVESCLKRLNTESSGFKNMTAKISGKIGAGISNASADDTVKGMLSNIAVEHFEIACYKSLRGAAIDCQEDEIARVAESILHEEEEMALFLEDHLEQITIAHLMHETDAVSR